MNQYMRPVGFGRLPVVIKNLLILNLLCFLAKVTLAQVYHFNLDDLLGMHVIGSEKFKPWQIITHLFMHDGISHIFYNMLALWMFGVGLELVWGAKRFLTYYLLTGIGAAIIHNFAVYYELYPEISRINEFLEQPSLNAFQLLFDEPTYNALIQFRAYNFRELFLEYFHNQGNDKLALQSSIEIALEYKKALLNSVVSVGASGAIFGLLIAFGLLFPNNIVFFDMFFPIKAKYLVIIYGAVEVISGIQNNPEDHVAHSAHIGGLIIGLIILKLWKLGPFRKL